MSCSHLGSRKPAALDGPLYQFKFQVSNNPIFANGANSTVISVRIFDEGGQEQVVKASELQLVSDTDIGKASFVEVKGMRAATLRPVLHSPKIRFMVIWKGSVQSEIQEIGTFRTPQKDKMVPIKSTGSSSQYVNGADYLRNESFTPGLFEGFQIDNRGTNRIVNPKANPDSWRSFAFEFEEQVTQNISFSVVDAPNSTTSHGMYSHFMLFPRKILPYVEIENGERKVTLTNGEKLEFTKDGVIKNNLFIEGPIDVSADRFKRTYANLKYQGKGILLRANARGQMPQQGQFEATKIDMEYGIKYSADVLIINGTTGQRCRRPKADFWPSGDISPIPFNFPTDKEFDAYLKSKCGFGIPEMEIEELPEEESVEGMAQTIWNRCENASPSGKVSSGKSPLITLSGEYLSPAIRVCLEEELQEVKQSQKYKVAFDLFFVMKEARALEKETLSDFVNKDIPARKEELLKDLKWVQDFSLNQTSSECMKAAPSAPGSLKFHEVEVVLKAPLENMCASIKESILPLVEADVSKLKFKVESDLSWLKDISTVKKDCEAKAASSIDSSFRFSSTPKIYEKSYARACQDVEKSEAYQAWLKENVGALEEKVYAETLIQLETLANKKVEACLEEYPMNNTLNRIRFKKVRESCLIDSWDEIENSAIQKALINPVPVENIRKRLGPERRRMQLKFIKENFT